MDAHSSLHSICAGLGKLWAFVPKSIGWVEKPEEFPRFFRAVRCARRGICRCGGELDAEGRPEYGVPAARDEESKGTTRGTLSIFFPQQKANAQAGEPAGAETRGAHGDSAFDALCPMRRQRGTDPGSVNGKAGK